jgi:hypothetical protein
MAKHKKKRTSRTSKGLRPSINKTTLRLVRENRNQADKLLNKIAAWQKGKKGYVTIANPNPAEIDKPFIKVTFERYFGGVYKDIKGRIRPAEDKNRIEL